jgi:hypothetical protein
MFMPPRCTPLAIFPDKNSQPHAGTTVTVLAALTQFYQSLAQFIANRSTDMKHNGDRELNRLKASCRRRG